MTGVAYIVPNFSSLNVILQVAHGIPVDAVLVLHNTVYALTYTAVVLCCAAAIFENGIIRGAERKDSRRQIVIHDDERRRGLVSQRG